MEILQLFLICYAIPAISISSIYYLLDGKLDEETKSIAFTPGLNIIIFSIGLIASPFALGFYFFENYKINWRD